MFSASKYKIPFSSLGLTEKPDTGHVWGMALILHDRDDASGNPISDQYWPEKVNEYIPSSWGQVRFGLPVFTPPSVESSGSVTIRHKLNGFTVPDVAVGGTIGNLCPGDSYYIWNEWGEANFFGAPDFNIQNQSDVADWPCFAKYFVTFPLDGVPEGKEIISAKLVLHQFGNSGDMNDPATAPKDPIFWLTVRHV